MSDNPKVFYDGFFCASIGPFANIFNKNEQEIKLCVDEAGIKIQMMHYISYFSGYDTYCRMYTWENIREGNIKFAASGLWNPGVCSMTISGVCNAWFANYSPTCAEERYLSTSEQARIFADEHLEYQNDKDFGTTCIWIPDAETLKDVAKAICVAALYKAEKNEKEANKGLASEENRPARTTFLKMQNDSCGFVPMSTEEKENQLANIDVEYDLRVGALVFKTGAGWYINQDDKKVLMNIKGFLHDPRMGPNSLCVLLENYEVYLNPFASGHVDDPRDIIKIYKIAKVRKRLKASASGDSASNSLNVSIGDIIYTTKSGAFLKRNSEDIPISGTFDLGKDKIVGTRYVKQMYAYPRFTPDSSKYQFEVEPIYESGHEDYAFVVRKIFKREE